jgi:hypothetical protein
MHALKNALIVISFAGVLAAGTAQAQQTPAPGGAAPAAPAATTRTDQPAAERKPASPRSAAERKSATERKAASDSTWDKTKIMTRRQWNKAKKAWAREKDKWNSCLAQAKAQKLKGSQRWSAVGSCMTN